MTRGSRRQNGAGVSWPFAVLLALALHACAARTSRARLGPSVVLGGPPRPQRASASAVRLLAATRGSGRRSAKFNGTWPISADVKPEMTVRLFPGYAQQLDDREFDDCEWLVSLRGWVCDARIRSARRRLTSQALQRGVWTAVHTAGEGDGEPGHPSGADPAVRPRAPGLGDKHRRALLRKRVGMFLIRCHRSVSVALQLTTAHGTQLWSSRTNSAGHFAVHAAVPQKQLLLSEHARRLPGGMWLTSIRTTPTEDGRVFCTSLLLIPPTGVSVISDIDDTIKETHVHNTRLMLRSTFVEEWRPVPGMPDLYREWAAWGAAFHYVSSSPWQLQGQLERLLSRSGFPPGTFHLKDLHYKGRRLLNLFRSSTALKPKQIRTLLKSFPRRAFILVGDSGEKDAQIYGDIARRHANQIHHVYIRNVPSKKVGYTSLQETRQRLAKHFRNVPDDKWTVFERASTLASAAEAWPALREPRSPGTAVS